jgi:hypothetical protein
MYYSIDKQGTREYIKEKTGLDLSDDILARLEDKSDGRDYNFLSPRTLTKLATWMAEAPESDLYDITSIINNMFDIGIGSYLREARAARDARQIRSAIFWSATANRNPIQAQTMIQIQANTIKIHFLFCSIPKAAPRFSR